MGRNQRELARLLEDETITLPVPRDADTTASLYTDTVYKVYTDLGGVQAQNSLKTRIGTWDVQYQGAVVELDEEQHFNRYRAQTLASEIYKSLPNFQFSLYKTLCVTGENSCAKKASRGGYWTTESCERQFGAANTAGDLTGNGAPRWKQRAFYDFIKDLAPLIFGFSVVRIAVRETICVAGVQTTVERALRSPDKNVRNALIDLITQRL